MFESIKDWFRTPTLASFDNALSRERLVQSSRIVFVDDETPLLIKELKAAGFSVDHDRTGNSLRNFDNQIYDVAIVDYHGVGTKLGTSQGLDLLRYIKRVSPRTRLIAYTSRSLTSTESEFFRLSHVVLPKDFGLADSFALIEGELRKAFEKVHLFDALLAKFNVQDPTERARLQNALVKALAARNEKRFREYFSKAVGAVAEKSIDIMISKLFLGTAK